jgi:hypothetical protein
MNQGDEIAAFLGRYAATLTGFDAKGAADLWATPGMIIDQNFAGVLNDRETIAQGLEQSYPTYRRLGLAAVTHECLDVTDLTEKITLVHVRWHFFDSEGTELTDSTAYYILRRDDAGLQACVCIQVDDAEKILALAAERGVHLTP